MLDNFRLFAASIIFIGARTVSDFMLFDFFRILLMKKILCELNELCEFYSS